MKIGIIGCGKQAPKHISGLRAAGVEHIVVTDTMPEAITRLTNADPSLIAAASVEDMMADPDIIGVSICTPTPSHAPLIRMAIAAGKHYLCEKPLCDDLDEARELADATAKAQLIGMVGYIYRFVPAFETAKEMLSGVIENGVSPVLGRVTNASFRVGGRGSQAVWKHQQATGGGAINEMMVHMVDLAHWLFGAPTDAHLLRKEQRWPTRHIMGTTHDVDAEDWTLTVLNHANNIDVTIQADFITPAFTQYIEIQGENGSFFGSIQPDMPNFVFCVEPRASFYAGKTELASKPVNLFEAQMGTFVDSMKSGTRPDRGSIRDALGVMETMARL